MFAASNLNVDAVRFLYEKESGIVDVDGNTALIRVCKLKPKNEEDAVR